MFAEAEAARLLDVSQSTLNYWLEGGKRRGKTYDPIIREKPRGARAPVTWAEFVEAGWLKQFRRERNVPMHELRAFITKLRDEFSVPYPLAHFQPFANEHQLARIYQVQDVAGLSAEFCAVAEVHNQMVMLPPTDAFVSRVDWEDGLALGWRPAEHPRSKVRMHPSVRFGRPAVGGISTEVLWEQIDAGATIAEVAEDFELPESDVRWAASYEYSRVA
jgi:uncharacterized protein (DUF433 family)